ncbi:hypothetical protein BDN72DRAFT_80553 [Pluteus cervinus]|uniref:Uncharacterized protein n=1 Tax=Pluteus cervinus TaxID=181527 RepID=A0ACD3B9I1_9AGAR|nr:hypothetical protein BDN72DRAFT_80553 [Pluteus cervinus]
MDNTQPDFRAVAGPRLIGDMLNLMLYGSLGVQVYFYYQAFPKDKRFIKYIVSAIFLLETLQTIVIFHDCFIAFTEGLVDPSAVNSIQLSWFGIVVLDGITSFVVQIFFAYRIFVLSESRIMPSIICVVALTQAIAAVDTGIIARSATFSEIGNVSHLPICIWLVGSAVCDILIASFMTYYLSRCSSKVRQTRTLISKLIRMTIETGTITASVATMDVILFLTGQPSLLSASLPLSIVLGKLYSNTTLAMLNSRRDISGSDEVLSGRPALSINH